MSRSKYDELRKLERAYDKAEGKLVTLRNELYPVGTKGLCKTTGFKVTVRPGSLYADQLYTDSGHMSWRNFELEESK